MLAYHLEDLPVPLAVRVPQVGSPCARRSVCRRGLKLSLKVFYGSQETKYSMNGYKCHWRSFVRSDRWLFVRVSVHVLGTYIFFRGFCLRERVLYVRRTRQNAKKNFFTTLKKSCL